MNTQRSTILSTQDHQRLQVLMTTLIGSLSPLAAIVRRKLGAATIIDPDHVSPDLVTSGRRVRFKIDGDFTQEKTLMWVTDKRPRRPTLSLQLPHGIALLGLRTGQSITIQIGDQGTQTLRVQQVFPDESDTNRQPLLRREIAVSVPSATCLSRWEDDGGSVIPRSVAVDLAQEFQLEAPSINGQQHGHRSRHDSRFPIFRSAVEARMPLARSAFPGPPWP